MFPDCQMLHPVTEFIIRVPFCAGNDDFILIFSLEQQTIQQKEISKV